VDVPGAEHQASCCGVNLALRRFWGLRGWVCCFFCAGCRPVDGIVDRVSALEHEWPDSRIHPRSRAGRSGRFAQTRVSESRAPFDELRPGAGPACDVPLGQFSKGGIYGGGSNVPCCRLSRPFAIYSSSLTKKLFLNKNMATGTDAKPNAKLTTNARRKACGSLGCRSTS
jgi:hypothetical protein